MGQFLGFTGEYENRILGVFKTNYVLIPRRHKSVHVVFNVTKLNSAFHECSIRGNGHTLSNFHVC